MGRAVPPGSHGGSFPASSLPAGGGRGGAWAPDRGSHLCLLLIAPSPSLRPASLCLSLGQSLGLSPPQRHAHHAFPRPAVADLPPPAEALSPDRPGHQVPGRDGPVLGEAPLAHSALQDLGLYLVLSCSLQGKPGGLNGTTKSFLHYFVLSFSLFMKNVKNAQKESQ